MTEIEELKAIELQARKVADKYNEAVFKQEYYQLADIAQELDRLEELIAPRDINKPEAWEHSP